MAGPLEAYPMNSGNGNYSYAKNSSSQRQAGDAAKLLINEGIVEKLNITTLSSSNVFRIADLGCSIGPNTFFAVQNILEAVETKYQTQKFNNQILEFHVLFNDHTYNDFNTLFKSLPSDRNYYAAGIPGSFHGRLFPNASLHFVYSSYALQWLSRVPNEVVDKSSVTWNKGKIYYSNAQNEVIMAYSKQHAEDMDRFLDARALEVVCGGLMALILPARLNGVLHSQVPNNVVLDVLGDCLMDLASKGIIDEADVDTFNIPMYVTSPQEIEEAIYRNKCFSIEKIESLPQMMEAQDKHVIAQISSSLIRAAMEGLITTKFGPKIIDELFNLYTKKLEEALSDNAWAKPIDLFVLLKRKENN